MMSDGVRKEIVDAVQIGDVKTVREYLIAEVIADYKNEKGRAIAGVKYAIKNGVDPFLTFDNSIYPIEKDQSKWNGDYLVYVQMSIPNNFSEKRFNHWQDVAEHVKRMETEKKTSSSPVSKKRKSSTCSDQNEIDKIKVAFAIGVTVAVIVAVAIAVK